MIVNLAKGDGDESSRIIQLAGQNPRDDPRIRQGERAIVFVGENRAGKSTMAAHLYANKHQIISDDTLVMDADCPEEPRVFPAFPQLKLWPDSLVSLAAAPSTVPRLYRLSEKRAQRLDKGFHSATLPLERIYLLERGDQTLSERLAPQDAFKEVLLAHSYVGHLAHLHGINLLTETDTTARHLRHCGKIAQRVPVFRLTRPWQLSELSGLVNFIEHDLEKFYDQFAIYDCRSPESSVYGFGQRTRVA